MESYLPIIALLFLVISALSGFTLWWKRKGADPTQGWDAIDIVLIVMGFPAVLGLVVLGWAFLTKKKAPDPPPGLQSPPPPRQVEDLVEAGEEERKKVVEHIKEVATDDEVAARGASLFDPGNDSNA